MGEGNVLTRVCPSVCPQGGGVRSSRGGGQVQLGEGGQVQPGGGGLLLRGGRYASCVHAGGISCFDLFLICIHFRHIFLFLAQCKNLA